MPLGMKYGAATATEAAAPFLNRVRLEIRFREAIIQPRKLSLIRPTFRLPGLPVPASTRASFRFRAQKQATPYHRWRVRSRVVCRGPHSRPARGYLGGQGRDRTQTTDNLYPPRAARILHGVGAGDSRGGPDGSGDCRWSGHVRPAIGQLDTRDHRDVHLPGGRHHLRPGAGPHRAGHLAGRRCLQQARPDPEREGSDQSGDGLPADQLSARLRRRSRARTGGSSP